jgi:hypothetical protein
MCSLFCPLRGYLDAFSARYAEHTCNQLGGPRAFVVGRNRVHDDARVYISVDNPNSGDVFNGAFADGMKVGNGIKENDKVGNHALRLDRFRSEEMDLICESAGKPLLADVVSL